MRMSIFAFACGVWLLQQQARLPDGGTLVQLAGAVLLLLALAAGLRRSRHGARIPAALAAALAGYALAAGSATLRLAEALDPALQGRDIQVTGVVAELPQFRDLGSRFVFEVESASEPVPRRLLLNWYRGSRPAEQARYREVRAGERWRLVVRLKRPHGSVNPHGRDFEAWLLERGLRATGYVRAGDDPQRLDPMVWRPAYAVERVREAIRARFTATLPDGEQAGLLVALAVGDQAAIPDARWQAYRRTGITHLMAISGLHITLIAGLAAAAAGWAWRRVPRLALRLPAQRVAVLAGALVAGGYGLLAGFAIPAQRTLLMLAVVALALWLGRRIAAGRVLALALLVVLLRDPMAVMAPGFWLSFGAVAVLMTAGAARLADAAPAWQALPQRWLRAQWAVTLALVPALLALFQQFSLVSPLANLVAIPLVSLLLTPLTLLAVVVPADGLLHLAHGLAGWLDAGVDRLATWPVWQQAAPPAWTVLLGVAGAAWLILPRGLPARWLGPVLLVPLFVLSPPRPAQGALRATVLDVGQGLAVHLQTAHHDLLYDAGPQYGTESDAGERLVVPYLRAVGVPMLSALVVTHGDRDHAGGTLSVLEELPVAWSRSSLEVDDPILASLPNHRPCRDGEAWEWDGVRFAFLHPAPPDAVRDGSRRGRHKVRRNDRACVLRVEAGGRVLLLTSDIEAAAERRLLRAPQHLAADVLLVPHHGSKTSSQADFLAAVRPRLAVFPVGHRNRFGHPHPEVWARYAGVERLRTDVDGAVTLELGRTGVHARRQRRIDLRYWHDAPPQ